MARLRSQSDILSPTRAGSIITSTAAPTITAVGQRWFNPTTAVTYQRTANADGTLFWMDITSGGIGTSAERGIDFVGDIDPHKATNLGVVGSVYYNREKNRHFVCTTATTNAQVWSGRYDGAGGTTTDYVNGGVAYRIHTFLLDGTFTMEQTTTCDILVIAGGGQGAGNEGSGGGGAGGFKYWSQTSTAKGSHAVTVGAGGSVIVPGSPSWMGGQGSNSQFGSLSVSTGGGGGGPHQTSPVATMNGGSGGGATGRGGFSGGTALANQGNAGGAATTPTSPGDVDAGGGGGGAGGAGEAGSPNNGGEGGVGYTEGATVYNWSAGSGTVTFPAAFKVGSGSNLGYAGGGGGGTENPGTNSTASHGGGAAAATINGTNGTGGGGGGKNGNAGTPGEGGSGIVIVRYAI